MTKKKQNCKQKLLDIWGKYKWKELIFLSCIFLISFLIRWIGLKFGFPLLTHPDESIIIDPVVAMTKNHTLNPGVFNRPNQVSYLFYFIYLNALSYLRFGTDMARAFPKYTLNFYFYARIWSAILGSLIPIIAYKIGKLFKNSIALPAALIFALFPSFVLHSLYITPDIPITFFTLLIMYFTIRYINKGDKKLIYFATIFAAVNTAEKYPGLISMGIIILGLALRCFEKNNHPLKKKVGSFLLEILKMVGVFLLTLFIIAPFLFIEYQKVIEALINESRSTHLGFDNLSWFGNLRFYIQSFGDWTNLLSILWIGLGLWGFIKWRDKSRFILLYGLLYWLLMSVLALHWERWALPMYITPLFLTAIGINYAFQKSKRVIALKYIALFLMIGFSLYQLILTVHVPIKMSFKDTRVTALSYCRDHEITEENTLFEGYTPLLPQAPKNFFTDAPPDIQSYDYIILSSYMYYRYYDEPQRYNQEILFYKDIMNTYPLIIEFTPESEPSGLFDRLNDITYYFKKGFGLTNEVRYQGPTIKIYAVDKMQSAP